MEYVRTLLRTFALDFQNIFSNPERRFAFLATIGAALAVVVFLLTDIRSLNRIFYKPEKSLLFNMANFCGLMSGCFMFGFIFSKLTLWVKSGSFKLKEEPKGKKHPKSK